MATTTALDNAVLLACLSRAANGLDDVRDRLAENSVINVDCLVRLQGQIQIGKMSIRNDAGNPRKLLTALLGRLTAEQRAAFIADVESGRELESTVEAEALTKALVKFTQKEIIARPTIKGVVKAFEV